MAVRTWDELNNNLKELIGDRTDDMSLAFVEDFSDTVSSVAAKATENQDWKAKYEENDSMWRKKYKDRFLNKEIPNDDPEEEQPKKKLRYEDLFTYGS